MLKSFLLNNKINIATTTLIINLYITTTWIASNPIYFRDIKAVLELCLSLIIPTFFLVLILSLFSLLISRKKEIINFTPISISIYFFILRSPIKKFVSQHINLYHYKYIHYLFDAALYAIVFLFIIHIFKQKLKIKIFYGYLFFIIVLNIFNTIKHKTSKLAINKKWVNSHISDIPNNIKLNQNIYFIILDSYAGYYGSKLINSVTPYEELKNNLNDKKFIEIKNFFTDGTGTQMTMPTFFNMSNKIIDKDKDKDKDFYFNHHYYHQDDIQKSHLVNFLKNKGYKINYVHGREYLISCHDEEGQCFPKSTTGNHITNIINVYLKGLHFFASHEVSQTDELIYNHFMNLKIERQKQFYYIHFGGPGHPPHTCFPFGDCNEDEMRENYIKSSKKINQKVSKIVKKIDSNDPNSIIIITSDHGPIIYDAANASKKTLNHYLSKQNGILFIRGLDTNKKMPEYILSKNLFPTIFKSLKSSPLAKTSIFTDDITFCTIFWINLKKSDLNNVNKYIEKTKFDCEPLSFNILKNHLDTF